MSLVRAARQSHTESGNIDKLQPAYRYDHKALQSTETLRKVRVREMMTNLYFDVPKIINTLHIR